MKKVLLRSLLVITVIIGISYGCLKLRYDRQEMPRILFLQESYNTGDYEYGTFIDSKGSIYTFKVLEDGSIDEKEKYRYLEENHLNSSADAKIVGKVEMRKLKEYYSLVKKASVGRIKLIETHPGVDVYLGYYKWSAFRYDILGRLEVVTLYGTGDIEIVNKSKYAKRVAILVRKILPEIRDPEQ